MFFEEIFSVEKSLQRRERKCVRGAFLLTGPEQINRLGSRAAKGQKIPSKLVETFRKPSMGSRAVEFGKIFQVGTFSGN